MDKKNCLKCGHSWINRTDIPVRCPKCKSYSWKVPRKELTMEVDKDEDKSNDKTNGVLV
jgi:predicted Zn-ribbon and HTH transcriptional regulator